MGLGIRRDDDEWEVDHADGTAENDEDPFPPLRDARLKNRFTEDERANGVFSAASASSASSSVTETREFGLGDKYGVVDADDVEEKTENSGEREGEAIVAEREPEGVGVKLEERGGGVT